MKKIQVVKDIMTSVFGRSVTVEYGGNGYCFIVTWKEGYRIKSLILWADNLKGGRVSFKVKCHTPEAAARLAKAMYNAVYYGNYPVDAVTKADVYRNWSDRGFCHYWVARLRMDRTWDSR